MFSIILLVAWAIIGLPFFQFVRSDDQPSQTKAAEKAANHADNQEPWLTKDAAGFFTFLLVVVGSGQIALFVWQLWLIRESLDDAKIAADAALVGANAARDSADTARLAMVNSDRAYVHYSGVRHISHKDPDGRIFWRVRPIWVNTGNTPTRNLRVYVHYEFRDDELPADHSFPEEVQPPRPTLIAPKMGVESEPRDFYGSELAGIVHHTKYFYIWGIARYRDVFPDTPDRITRFCVYAVTTTGDLTQEWSPANLVEIVFANYHRHFCADEDCENQA